MGKDRAENGVVSKTAVYFFRPFQLEAGPVLLIEYPARRLPEVLAPLT